MNEITTLIPCNLWTITAFFLVCILIIAIADHWDCNDRYNKLKEELDQQNQDKFTR